MLSPADMLVVGVAALLFFGPDQLPRVARKVGSAVRDVQMTSQSFIREMERAADDADEAEASRKSAAEHISEPTPAPEPWLPEEPLESLEAIQLDPDDLPSPVAAAAPEPVAAESLLLKD